MGFFSKKQETPVVKEEILEEVVNEEPTEEQAPVVQTEEKEIINTFADEMGIIAEGTTIHGDITTQGHVAIVGVVEGKVVAAGNVMLTGIVKGTIECNNIIIDCNDFNQSIKAKGSVSVKANTTVIGSISCKHISISGTVIGNIKAQGNVGLTKDASVKGDIVSSVLAVEPGAKISGNIQVR